MHFNALHKNNFYNVLLFEDFNNYIASTLGIITGSVATSILSIHHFTCDITKIFQSPLPSPCILFHPSLAPPFSSSIAHYTTPRALKTQLHIIPYSTISKDTAAHCTIHYEFSKHCWTFYNTPRTLKILMQFLQYTTTSQGTPSHYTIHHGLSRQSNTFYNIPWALKTLQHVIQYTTNSQSTAVLYVTHQEL